MSRRHHEQFRHLPSQVQIHDSNYQLQQEQRQPKEDEEQIETGGRSSKHVHRADLTGHVARLDQEHANIDKNESQFNHHHQHTIFTSSQRLDRELRGDEQSAHEECHEDAPQLLILW
eukprot:7382167-Prymnesium_polylepis.3